MVVYKMTKIRHEGLNNSLIFLSEIANLAYNSAIRSRAIEQWQKDLDPKNPQWKYVEFKSFIFDSSSGKAHIFAMIDKRLPEIGMVGYFACTDSESGARVISQACKWLKTVHKIKDVYGPINGTLPNDYRINLSDDFVFPGEPLNPKWYLEAFELAGFSVFNRYASGRLKHINIILRNAFKNSTRVDKRFSIRPFEGDVHGNDFKIYNTVRNKIFPKQSIYCAAISLEERIYNSSGKFDPRYTYFLLDNSVEIGFVMAYIYDKMLILKTIGILPEYRGMKLSRLLLEPVHKNAMKDGAKTAIYALVREGNEVHRRRHPLARIFRRYVTMHKSI